MMDSTGASGPPTTAEPLLHRRLSKSAAAFSSRTGHRLRKSLITAWSWLRAQDAPDPAKPTQKAAWAYFRQFLPQTSDGKLIRLNCSDDEFSAHVGSGVAIYMHFVKMTMWMFVLATIISIPQFVANIAGHQFQLQWPLDGAKCPESGGLMGLVSKVLGVLAYFFYAGLLGNVSFSESRGTPHLISEFLLSTIFCIYVYWIWHVNNKRLAALEAEATVHASDFAVAVSRLPPSDTDTARVRAHFSFFGPVASVVISRDQHQYLGLLERQRHLTTQWRHLHIAYTRATRALRASSHSSSGVQLRPESMKLRRQVNKLLVKLEQHWGEMLRARQEMQQMERKPCVCTGSAIVVFEQLGDAARCVRHFELIRRHESDTGGVTVWGTDFRQQYYHSEAGAIKLDVQRAPEPSDIIWGNLRFSHASRRWVNLKTTFLIFMVSCVSTVVITFTDFATTLHSAGLLTTLWSTPVIIVSNLAIFIGQLQLAIRVEQHKTRSSQHMHMLIKMAGFQCFNTVVAVVSFAFYWPTPSAAKLAQNATCPLLYPPVKPDVYCYNPPDVSYFNIDFECSQHWYVTGGVVLVNVIIGDIIAILGLIEFVRPDKLILRYILAPKQPTQAEMNQFYCMDSDLYLPFRYQLQLKWVVLTMFFCSAMPILLPVTAGFMYLSLKVDRYNLLRVFKQPPRTTDRTITMSVLHILPIGAFGHVFFAIIFYSVQAKRPVPLVYYGLLLGLMAVIMMKILTGIKIQRARPIREEASQQQDGAAEVDTDARIWSVNGDDETPAADTAKTSIVSHLDTIELYVPPLTSRLLKDIHENKAVKRSMVETDEAAARSESIDLIDPDRATSSTHA